MPLILSRHLLRMTYDTYFFVRMTNFIMYHDAIECDTDCAIFHLLPVAHKCHISISTSGCIVHKYGTSERPI